MKIYHFASPSFGPGPTPTKALDNNAKELDMQPSCNTKVVLGVFGDRVSALVVQIRLCNIIKNYRIRTAGFQTSASNLVTLATDAQADISSRFSFDARLPWSGAVAYKIFFPCKFDPPTLIRKFFDFQKYKT